MTSDPVFEDEIESSADFEAALRILLAAAVANDVDPRGSWEYRSDGLPSDWVVMNTDASADHTLSPIEVLREFTPHPYQSLNSDGEILTVNDVWTNLLGYDRDEAVGRWFGEFLTGEGAELFESRFPEFKSTGSVSDLELEMQCADGAVIVVSFDGMIEYDDTGSPVRTHCQFTDITERKNRERDLERFKSAVTHTGHAVYIVDSDGTITYTNPEFENITGFSPSEAVGKNPRILSSGEMSDAYYTDLWETVLAGDVWEEEIINRRKNGERYYAHQTIAPVTDASGEIVEFVAIQTDITDEKSQELELQRRTDLLQVLQEANQRLTRASDPEATVTDIIQIIHSHPNFGCTFLVLLDDGQVDLACESGSELTTTQVRRFHSDAYLSDVFEQGTLQIEDVTSPPHQQHSEDASPHAGVAFPIKHNSQAYGVLTIHFSSEEQPPPEELQLLEGLAYDIGLTLHSIELQTERERLTEELQASIQQLQFIDRVLRHNIKNDMNVITGHAELLSEYGDETVGEYARTIVDKSEELLETIDKGRKTIEQLGDPQLPQSIDLGAIISHTISDLQERYPNAQITIEGPTGFQVQATQSIERALDECLTNAIIHSDKDTPSIEVRVEDNEQTVTLQIADDGPGIPEMERKTLMDESKENPLYHGRGVGLWLVKQIVRHSGGSLSFDENEPRGSIITIRLRKGTTGNDPVVLPDRD